MSIIITIVLLMVSVEMGSSLYDGCTSKLYPTNCPLQFGNVGRKRCIKMKTADFGSAFTRLEGDRYCKETYGNGAHLADIHGKQEFLDTRCYMIQTSTVANARDPKVLLGMTYNKKTKTTYDYDGTEQSDSYWGKEPSELTLGDNMIIRAHETVKRSFLSNFGYKETRYERILCSWPVKK
uniref:uncharacterized protein LOC120337340 n=1 Tax=Styela clava TaxID=7725 RepID=UPI00193AAD0C|nr:uncharacterized protein LOC120337340 [Styela clava]